MKKSWVYHIWGNYGDMYFMQQEIACEKVWLLYLWACEYFIKIWGKKYGNANVTVFALHLKKIFGEDTLTEAMEYYDTLLETTNYDTQLELEKHDFQIAYWSDVVSKIKKNKWLTSHY